MTPLNMNPIELYHNLNKDFSEISQFDLSDPNLRKRAIDSIKGYTEQITAILANPQIINKYRNLFLGLDRDVNQYKSQVIKSLRADANPTVQTTQWIAELNLISTENPERRYPFNLPMFSSSVSSSSSSSSSAIERESTISIEDRRSALIELGKALKEISSSQIIRTITDDYEFYSALLNAPEFIKSLPKGLIKLDFDSPVIPEEIEVLKDHAALSINALQATELPKSFSKFTSLTSLCLDCPNLEKLPQDFFTAHPVLGSLTLRCPLALNDRDTMPRLETTNSTITDLILRYDCSNPLPQFTNFCPNIQRLVIDGLQEADKHIVLPPSLIQMKLKNIELINTNVRVIPKWISSIKKLQSLIISGKSAVTDLPNEIFKVGLTSLDIDENQLNEHGRSVVQTLRNASVVINHEGEESESDYSSDAESKSDNDEDIAETEALQ